VLFGVSHAFFSKNLILVLQVGVCDPEVMDLMDALPSISCLKLLNLCCMWCFISCPRLWTFAEISLFDKALSSFLYSELVVFLKHYKQSQEVHFSQICVKLQFGSLNVNVCSYWFLWAGRVKETLYLFKAIMRNLWFQECSLICWQAMLELQGFEQSSDMVCLMFHFYRWMIMKYVLVLIWGIMHCMFVCYIWQNLPLCTYCNILQSFTSCRVDISRLTLDREFSWLNFLMH